LQTPVKSATQGGERTSSPRGVSGRICSSPRGACVAPMCKRAAVTTGRVMERKMMLIIKRLAEDRR
jgi:hypothetical protein